MASGIHDEIPLLFSALCQKKEDLKVLNAKSEKLMVLL
jgi:hypothetical protein